MEKAEREKEFNILYETLYFHQESSGKFMKKVRDKTNAQHFACGISFVLDNDCC